MSRRFETTGPPLQLQPSSDFVTVDQTSRFVHSLHRWGFPAIYILLQRSYYKGNRAIQPPYHLTRCHLSSDLIIPCILSVLKLSHSRLYLSSLNWLSSEVVTFLYYIDPQHNKSKSFALLPLSVSSSRLSFILSQLSTFLLLT